MGDAPQLSASGTDFAASGNSVTFTPQAGDTGDQMGALTLSSPDGHAAPNTITLDGVAAQVQNWYIDTTGFFNELKNDFSLMSGDPAHDEKSIVGTQFVKTVMVTMGGSGYTSAPMVTFGAPCRKPAARRPPAPSSSWPAQ